MVNFGYKREAELYYFLPEYGSKLPEGMTLISGPDDVGKMIDDLKGSKTCGLYIVTNDSEDMDTEVDILYRVYIFHLVYGYLIFKLVLIPFYVLFPVCIPRREWTRIGLPCV